jgi:hypothetical protein
MAKNEVRAEKSLKRLYQNSRDRDFKVIGKILEFDLNKKNEDLYCSFKSTIR